MTSDIQLAPIIVSGAFTVLGALLVLFVGLFAKRVNGSIGKLISTLEKFGGKIEELNVFAAESKLTFDYIKEKQEGVEEVLAFSKKYDHLLETNRNDMNTALGKIRQDMQNEMKLVRHRQHWFVNKLCVLKGHVEKQGDVNFGEWKLPGEGDL